MTTTRLTAELEKSIRGYAVRNDHTALKELFAELDAVRAERDEDRNTNRMLFDSVKELRDENQRLREQNDTQAKLIDNYAAQVGGLRDNCKVKDAQIAELERELELVINQHELTKEDLECVHLWLDDLRAPRGDGAYRYSIVGRAKQLLCAKDAQIAELRGILLWALGEVGDFPLRQEGRGAYWWRKELRRKMDAALARFDSQDLASVERVIVPNKEKASGDFAGSVDPADATNSTTPGSTECTPPAPHRLEAQDSSEREVITLGTVDGGSNPSVVDGHEADPGVVDKKLRKCEKCGGLGPTLWDQEVNSYLCVSCHSDPRDEFFVSQHRSGARAGAGSEQLSGSSAPQTGGENPPAENPRRCEWCMGPDQHICVCKPQVKQEQPKILSARQVESVRNDVGRVRALAGRGQDSTDLIFEKLCDSHEALRERLKAAEAALGAMCKMDAGENHPGSAHRRLDANAALGEWQLIKAAQESGP